MAAINGHRPRRVNNDGKSITETRLAATDLLPGSFVVINATTDKFTQVAAAAKPTYIIGVDSLVGEDILTAVKADESAIGDYVEQGRQFAALVKASTVCVKDTPLKVGANGVLEVATLTGETPDTVFAYSQEIYTVPATPATGSHVLIRVA